LGPSRSLGLTGTSLAVVLALIASSVVVAREPAADTQRGFRVLEGRAAAAFRLPADVRLVGTWHDALHGLTFERYQQYHQPFNAHVQGAQLTIVRRGAGTVLVVGAHYPSLAPGNRLLIDGNQAIGRALASHAVLGALPAPLRETLQSRS
jgi:hypothetical protein